MKQGEMISFEKDGVIYTDLIDSVRYTCESPAIHPRPNRLQLLLRKLTPPRWRRAKPGWPNDHSA